MPSSASRVGQSRVTVSGSFRQSWSKVSATIEKFEVLGSAVLSPNNSEPDHSEGGFVYLKGDNGPPIELERNHLDAIRRSDLLYIVNPDGALGPSVSLELGYAVALGIRVYSSHLVPDPVQSALVTKGTPRQALASLPKAEGDLNPNDVYSLHDAQNYVRDMARVRGFDKESPAEVLVLLLEEMGELARATRLRIGLSVSESAVSKAKAARLELADCLIYLLHYANQNGIEMVSAFREKERINAAKTWSGGEANASVSK